MRNKPHAMLVGLPNGVFEGFTVYTHRSIVALTLVAAAACSGTDVTRPVFGASDLAPVASLSSYTSASSITISPATANLAVGSTLTLSGSIKSSTGVDLTATLGSQVTLASSDTTIAKVSNLGVVTGIRAGVATITAKLGTLSSKSTITVLAPTSPSSITISPATATLAVGAKLTLSGSVKSVSGADLTASLASQIVMTCSDATVATVSSTGVVTGLKSGVAVVTVKVGTLSSSSTITVGSGATSPTPAPTPTPISPTQPSSGSGVSSVDLVSDDFTKYSSTAAFLANVSSNIGGTGTAGNVLYSDGANASLAQIDPTVQYNGHATLKYNQPGGTSNTPELWVGLPQSLSVMWMRAKIRFGPGFTTTGTISNSANAYKLFGWAWDTYYGSGRIEITNTNQYQDYWTMLSKSTSSTVGSGTNAIGGSVSTEWTDGAWYDYIVEIDFSKSPGVARLWIARDGQTPVLRAISSGSMQSGMAFPKLTNVNWGMNFNQIRTASQTQALWYGQWEVVDGVAHPDPFHLGVQ